MVKICLLGPKGRWYNSEENDTEITRGISAYGLEKGFGIEAHSLLGNETSQTQLNGSMAWSWVWGTSFYYPHTHQGLCLWGKREVRVGFR